ncbi:cytochrome ubiquinol oxidase subunit I [Afifella pfennigii]|uniref:cytochrome ubiquinol oxidase subunit I n=1 Tax=Afifella pfennigii TaxID=209897 RepID=UPI0005576493|nr:cytochrome ubiquinol oxidase subunit I [Afifella pfennigii]
MLARIQFAFTVAFHIVFPAFTIGTSAFVATLEGYSLATGSERHHLLARYWTKVFAVSFAMGVVSGIVLSYQFGTNWSRYSEVLGNVIGPAIGYEVLTAFFLEAGFLGIMLFGWNKVPRPVHFAASVLVALGTALSAFWILSANSWMHYPAGYEMRDGIAYPTDWWQIIFNPTFPWRFTHMVVAAYLTTALVVMAVGARFILKNRFLDDARTMLRMGLGLLLILAPLQLLIGDQHGLNTLKYQPAKVAAIEAHWPQSGVAPLILFAIPDEAAETNRYEISIPNVASLILTHEWEGEVTGLKAFAAEDRPPVWPVFFAFRLMVGIGLFIIALAFWGGWAWLRGRLIVSDRFLQVAAYSWPLGFIAILAGWMVTEIGRQPWVATGILRTAEAASPVPAAHVATSLALFVIVYAIIFAAGIRYMNRLLNKGPDREATLPELGVPQRPLSGAGGGKAEPSSAAKTG